MHVIRYLSDISFAVGIYRSCRPSHRCSLPNQYFHLQVLLLGPWTRKVNNQHSAV